MEDKFLTVYDGLRQKNPDMPDYNKFKLDLQQNEQARADVYNGLKKNNPDMPDFETFSRDMGLVGSSVRQEADKIDTKKDKGGFWDTYLGDVVEKIGAGAASFGGSVYSALEHFNNAVLKPWDLPSANNDKMDLSDSPELKRMLDEMGVPENERRLTDGRSWMKRQADNAYQYADVLRNRSDRYKGENFEDLLKKGDYSGAVGDVFLQASESLPQSLMAMFGGGAGLALTGVSAGTQKYDELDKMPDMKDLPEYQKVINAVSTGTFEALSEKLGDVPIGNWLTGLYSKMGVRAGEEAVKSGFQRFLSDSFKKYGVLIAPVSEGVEEVASQIAENATDFFTGVSDELNLLDGVKESFVYGAGGGAQFSLGAIPGVVRRKHERRKINKDFETAREMVRESFPVGNADAFVDELYSLPRIEQEEVVNDLLGSDELSDEQKNSLGNLYSIIELHKAYNNPESRTLEKVYGKFEEFRNRKSGDIVTARDVDGNPLYVLDETEKGSLVLRNDGTKEFIPISELKDVRSESVDEHVNAFLSNYLGVGQNGAAAVSNGVQEEDGNVSEAAVSGVTYNGVPVHVLDDSRQDDGTVLVEDASGETMRVPESELSVADNTNPQEDVAGTEVGLRPEAEEIEQADVQIPMTEDGKPDYDSMTPEMFADEFEKEFGAEAAKSELEQMSVDIDAQIEKLQKKSLTNRNERAENMREIARLKGEQESVQVALERYAAPEEAAQEEVLRSMSEQKEVESEQDIKPIREGFFGGIYDQFKGKANEAIRFLMNQKEGEALGALHHPQVGDIDLVWGKEGTSHSDGYGLSKIAKYHPEVLDNLQEILDDMSVVNASANRINLESDTHKAAVRLEWDGEKKTWLLTAFEKETPASIDKTTDTDENHKDLQGDTALLQNAGVSSDVKDTEKISENQEAVEDVEKIRDAESEVELNPTDAQKEAGNYRKGHVRLDGYDITIENPKGSERSGIDANGNRWSNTMNNTYGYIRGTKGVDGDHIDVFLSDSPQNGNVYVVDQVKEDGTFDEHKVMYGFDSMEEAKDAYLANYSPDWKGLGAITEVSKDEFKKWVDSSKRKTKPFSEYKSVKKEAGENDGVRFREVENTSVDEVNRRFNEELERLTEENSNRVRFELGNPSESLLSSGIPNKPLVLYGNKLIKKSQKHGFNVQDVKDLPNALQNPIGVFSGSHPNSYAVLTEMTLGDKKVLVSVETNKDGEVDFNLISSVFGKNDKGVIKWILDGKLRNVNKEKALSYISASAPIADATYKKELDSATNIVENFENPTVLEGEILSAIDELSDELGVKVNKVRSRKDLPEGVQRRMRGGRYPGLFDPNTGEVYVVMDEITDVEDAQATMLHEVVGHKGIRGLFGDKIGEFASRVLDSIPESEREAWVNKYDGNEQLAAEEYVARFAEGYENPTMWEKVKAVVRDLLRDLGIDLRLSDNDLKYVLWKGVNGMKQGGTFMNAAEYAAKDRETQRVLFREVKEDEEFADKHLNLGELVQQTFQDRMVSVKNLLDEVKRRGGKVTDYANPYVAENLATSKSKAQIEDFNRRLWDPLMEHVKVFTDKGKTRNEVDRYMMAKHAPERNALLFEREGVENGSGMTNEDAKGIVDKFEKDFDEKDINAFWEGVRNATKFTTETWQKHGLIDRATKDYYDSMYEYYVPLRGWEESEAYAIEYIDKSRGGGTVSVNKKAKGRKSLADSPLAYIANMAHSAIVAGNKNDVKRNVFEMMALNKNPDLYHLKKVYQVNTGTEENPVWVEQLEKPAAEFWNAGRVKIEVNRRNEAKREFYKTKQHQVEAFVNGQKYIMEFNGNMGVKVANAINGVNVVHGKLLQNSIGKLTRWMSANFTSRNPEFVITNFMRDFGYAIPAYWMKGGNAGTLLKNMPKAFRAIHNDLAGKKVDSELQQMYDEFKMNGGLTGYVHMTDIDSYKKWIERDIRKMSGDKTFGDVVLRNRAMRAGADLLEYLAQMSENSTRFAVYMSERQSGKSATEAAYAAKEITTNFNRKGNYSGVLGSLFGFFNATVQGSANALGLAKRSPGKFAIYCGSLIAVQYLASALCRMFGGDDEIGENNYDRLAEWVKYNNFILPDPQHEGRFITIPLPHFFRALSSMGVIAGEVMNGKKTASTGIESLFDAVSGDLTPVEIATPQFKNPYSLFRSLIPTAFKPLMEVYVNRNFMNLPISREAIGDQKKTLPKHQLAKKTTNPTLVSISKWLNEKGGGGEYTTAEISYDVETGDVERNGWRTWMDVNPAKFEHVVEGIFGGRLKFFNNVYKTVDNTLKGEFEASTTPILRPLYQMPKGNSAWIKFYEVRDDVIDIDAKASEFMKMGNYDAYGMINYRNARLVETYKAYETVVNSLNEALRVVDDPAQAEEIERQKDDVVRDFAIEAKRIEKEYADMRREKELVK